MNIRPTFRAFAILAFFVIAITRTATAQVAFATEDGTVTFRSDVPLHSFTGKSDALNGRITPADSTVDFFVDMTTVETGVGKRDRDMRKTLNTDEFPFAEFFGKLVTPFDPDSEEEQAARVEGEFRIHGIGKPLVADGTIKRDGDELRVSAEFEISMEAYDIRPPRVLMLKVADIQKIAIDVVLRRVTL